MISATFDTNVYIRAFNFAGPAALLVGDARQGSFRLDTSDAIMQETLGVMREKFQANPYVIDDIRQKLEALCNRVTPTRTLRVITEDPDDDRILECAVTAKSDYIVSEDKDLLRQRRFEGILIVTVDKFLTISRGQSLNL